MNMIKDLDITIHTLNRLTNKGTLVTIEDILQQTNIERHSQLRILEYLNKCNYCEKVSNAYKITFEGEYLIDRTIFPFKNRPFLYDKIYKQIKFLALLLNTLLVLLLGVLNYQINKERGKVEKPKINKMIENKASKMDRSITIKKDTINNKLK